ncbi:MAG TPA: DUF885 domain-containing protein [Candidatus Limnocylindrales bacterium]|nr:DUF885 domain-containing protein [Candidatus Limnocylindrales bacterium]
MTDTVDALAADYQETRLRTFPTWAHMIGDYRYVDSYEQASRDAEDAQIAEARAFVERANAIAAEGLSADERITREMVAWDATARADMVEARLDEFGADPIFGSQASLPVRIPKLTIPDPDIAEGFLGKYRDIATYFHDLAGRHREGVANGRTPADFAVRQTVEQIDRWLAGPIADDPLLHTAEPRGVEDPDEWRGRLAAIVERDVRPAMADYRDTLRDEVQPHARPNDKPGLCWVAGGDEAYAAAIRYYTTVSLSAQEIHDIGLAQVESLAREYRALGPDVVGTNDLPKIFAALRDDSSLHHHDPDEIVTASKTAMAKARAAMGEWFGILPKADCDVEATTNGAIAYYFPPAKDGSRGGVFFMNVADPTGWGRYDIESTSYHEGIPGHHLQIAIATELEGLPEFRKRAFIAAYGEGWGLYTERLADEMGLYSSPVDRMGMLSADSMRACRLVVDTGMHALGWSRRQAIDYMLANSPMREGHVTAEIDRYAVTPGQALAYMIGRLEIQRIRREAEAALGDRFRIKEFHDAVLGAGPMPLPILARRVEEWVSAAA